MSKEKIVIHKIKIPLTIETKFSASPTRHSSNFMNFSRPPMHACTPGKKNTRMRENLPYEVNAIEKKHIFPLLDSQSTFSTAYWPFSNYSKSWYPSRENSKRQIRKAFLKPAPQKNLKNSAFLSVWGGSSHFLVYLLLSHKCKRNFLF